MSMYPVIEEVAREQNLCGEGPLWDAAQGRLLWVDNVAGTIFEHHPAGGKIAVLARDLPVSGLALNHDGSLVIGGSKGVSLRRNGALQSVLATHEGEALNFNDIIASPQGNLYDATGKVERRLRLPVQQVSSVMFGGPDLADLYITTAGEAWPSRYAPLSFNPAGNMGGSLYRVRLEIAGRAEHHARFNLGKIL